MENCSTTTRCAATCETIAIVAITNVARATNMGAWALWWGGE